MEEIHLLSATILVYDSSADKCELNFPQVKVSAYKLITSLDTNKLQILAMLLTDKFSQKFLLAVLDAECNLSIFGDDFDFDCWVVRKSLISGITNNLARTVQSIIENQFNYKFSHSDEIFTAEIYFGRGEVPDLRDFCNPLIQKLEIFTAFDSYKQREFYFLENGIELPTEDILLEKFSHEHMLNLSIAQMKAIRNYFLHLKRNPSKMELEMLAQSWSEHCNHNIFSAQIDEIKDGIYKHYIKQSTDVISKRKKLCISVFSDNAGAIVFDANHAVAAKVETHNSPSALEPYGGAMTGLLGVNRDIIGFGLGAMPISNHYAFCFFGNANCDDEKKYYRDKALSALILSKESIEDGVTQGVKVAGNHSGIPTTNGLVYFSEGFAAKPLVFVGTVGITKIDKCFKEVQDGDLVVIIGGRTGKDGVHGATFSSVNLGSVSSTVVQIGDAITQKKFSDAIIKEARELGLYSAITDNGAGGFSSSIGEMGRDGFSIDLEKVKLKFPQMEPWEIWISESQERMTLAVPKEKYYSLEKIMHKHDVEVSVIGKFNKSGKAIVRHNEKILLNLDTHFIHGGSPRMKLESEEIFGIKNQHHLEDMVDEKSDLLDVLAHKNIKSRRKFSHLYDHEVQGKTVLKPLHGEGKVFADATILKPLVNSKRGIVQSQSLGIFYEESSKDGKDFYPYNHPYFFAERAIETAIRNTIVAGADIEQIALLDNFCWSNFNSDFPYNKKRLWQLKIAAQACYDVSTFFSTPFISGKDSMFNNATLYDENGNQKHISNFPALLITSIGIIDDIEFSISLDAKIPGDIIYVVGNITDLKGHKHGWDKILALYTSYTNAVREGIIASGIAINFGGLLVALAKKLIAGLISADVNLAHNLHLKYKRFPGIVVTIDPNNEAKFKKIFDGIELTKIGKLKESTDEGIFLNVSNLGKYRIEGNKSLRSAYDNLSDGVPK